MQRIYLDHAATTPARPEVVEAMERCLRGSYGNPSSIHSFGQEAKGTLDDARDTLAEIIGAEPSEITFVSGGTEADNLALVGVLLANQSRGKHLVTTQIEHEAILQAAAFVERMGWRVTQLPVDSFGRVTPEQVAEAITEETVLVSVMHANNEVGTIAPISEIAKVVKAKGALMHTDAVQSFGQLPVHVDELGVDLLSVSAHKIYGPKGVGALYVRRGTAIEAILHGGGQERERRSGTENVPGIAGFAVAARMMRQERDELAARLTMLRDEFVREALDTLPGAELNGHPTERLPNNINISIAGVEGESLLLGLDLVGIAASSGSACASGSIAASHVLVAMGVPAERVRGALRLTLGRATTREEMATTLDALRKTSVRLRQMTEHALGA